MRQCCPEHQRGFSLIELLTVTALSGLLLTMLLPGLKSARDQARSVVCASHLREMGVAAGLYLQANGSRYPVAYWYHRNGDLDVASNWDFTTIRNWDADGAVRVESGLLWGAGVSSRVLQCPTFVGGSNSLIAGAEEPHSGYNYNTSYVGHGQWESVPDPISDNMIRRPAQCALFGDGEYEFGANKFMRAPWPNPGDQGFFGRYSGTQGFRHRAMTNVSFADGHAESRRKSFTQTSTFEQPFIAAGTGFLSVDNGLYDLE